MCNQPELIIGYVYGELPDTDRRAFEAHIAVCPDCRNEVAGLRGTRGRLAAWAPPEPEFGFRIVRGGTTPPARRWFAPAWGLAAAAVLVLAAAAAIANVEVRYDASGLVVRTGWARDSAVGKQAGTAPREPVTPVAVTSDEWRSQFTALDARLRELERGASREASGGTQLASGPRMSDAEIIRRVREMVGQSETRQQREFAMQIAQVLRDVDRARQLDFLQIQRGLGQHRAQTSAEVAQTLNYYLTRASQQK